jgi:hypothetical protein
MPPRRAHANPLANNVALDSSLAVLAALHVMQQELATLRQAIPVALVGSSLAAAKRGATISVIHASAIPTGAVPGGATEVALSVSGISQMQWTGLKLDSFDSNGSPVEAADWLTYVEDKMNVFEVVYGDRVCYGTQLLKGETQIWWRGVPTTPSCACGYLA